MKKWTSGGRLTLCLFFLGVAAATALVLSGCGSNEPAWNITGSWYTYHDVSGTVGALGPDLLTFSQSDNDLSGTTTEGETITGTLYGTDVNFSWTGSDGTSYTYAGTAGDGNMSGTWTASNGQSGAWRAIMNVPAVATVTGNWNFFQTVTGSTEQGPNVFSLQQSGNSLSGTTSDGAVVTGNINNQYVILTWADATGTTYMYMGSVTANGSTLSGTWTTPGGQSGTWRATEN